MEGGFWAGTNDCQNGVIPLGDAIREAETRIYQVLQGCGLAPQFLERIHEGGKVLGFLLEKIPDRRNAERADLEICKAALRRFQHWVLLSD